MSSSPTMRAIEVQTLDGPDGLALVQRAEPEAGPDAIVVDVHAAAVSFADLLISRGAYQLKPDLPFVPGASVAGIVRKAPATCSLSPGDRVWSFLSEPGGFAEVVVRSPDEVFALPDALTMAQGSTLGINFLTAVFALGRRAALRAGECALVLGGAGGLGSACVSVAAARDARVIAVVSTQSKAEIARHAGATDVVVDADWRDQVLALTDGRGVDVVADVVGGDQTLQALRTTAPEGRLLILGFASGEVAKLAMNRPLLRNVSIVGAGLGALAESVPTLLSETAEELMGLVDAGLRPVVGEQFPLERAADALRAFDQRRAEGNLVLVVRDQVDTV